MRSIRCSSNEHAIDLLILRALGLVEKKKEPVVLVVKSTQKAKEVLALLDEQLATAKIANLFTQIKRKRNFTIYGNPDFIICSYQKLYHLLTKTNSDKKNQIKKERLKVSGVVFLTPLSRTNYRIECILLDQILNVLPKRSAYTFIHGEELCFRKEDLEWLIQGPAIVYKNEDYSRRDLLKDFRLNIFEDRNLVAAARRENDFSGMCGASYLLILILSATFHRRKNLKELKIIVKQSISYKLWFAFEEALLKDPDEIITYSINYQLWLILDYLSRKCKVKLVELKENGYYYLTSEGHQFFHRFCFSDGLTVSLFYVLHALSKKLEKGYLTAKDLENLLNDFIDLNIIWDVFYLDDNKAANYEVQKALNNNYAFRSAHDIFEGLDVDFGLLAEDAKRSLAAQKSILREQNDFKYSSKQMEDQIHSEEDDETIIESIDEPKITKIYSKKFLENFILKIVSQENITPQRITELAIKTGIGKQHIKNTLIKLEQKGECQKISTKGVHCDEVIYGIEENLLAEPHLSETCDTCVSIDQKIRLCTINRLLMEVAYSSLKKIY